jgi:hypothetical protein
MGTKLKLVAPKIDISTAIHQISEMTARNDHTAAYVAGAKALGAKELAKKLDLVRQLVDLEGCLPSKLSDYRHGLYEQLMAFAKQELSAKDFDQFYRAF